MFRETVITETRILCSGNAMSVPSTLNVHLKANYSPDISRAYQVCNYWSANGFRLACY